MKITTAMGRTAFAGLALASLAGSGTALAQAWPARPITVVVPFAAGGPVDIDTRKYGKRLTDLLGQPVLVDYKVGAGTAIGSGFVARARPDGYTLLTNSSAFSTFPALYKDLNFDPLKDLAPITQMSSLLSPLLVPPNSPFRGFPEYMAFVKANPGKINFGTTGTGDISHLSALWLHSHFNGQVTYVPYKGAGPLAVEITAGRVDIGSGSLALMLPLIKAGKLRALAVKSRTRVKVLPEVPAVNEAGPEVRDYADDNWLGFFAPAGLPAPVQERLWDALVRIVRMPEVIAELEAQSSVPVGNTPAQFRAQVTEEIARWKKVVESAGITLQQ